MERTNTFTNGNIVLTLIKFTVPVLFAIFLQTMYGAADMLIVGQSKEKEAGAVIGASIYLYHYLK